MIFDQKKAWAMAQRGLKREKKQELHRIERSIRGYAKQGSRYCYKTMIFPETMEVLEAAGYRVKTLPIDEWGALRFRIEWGQEGEQHVR